MKKFSPEGLCRTLKRIIEYGFKRKYHYTVPLLTKIKYAALGFNPDEYVFHDLSHNNYKEYLTDYEVWRGYRLNRDFIPVLNNKLIFEEIACKYIKVPTNYAFLSNAYIYGLKNYNVNNENIIQFIESVKCCVLKILSGGTCGVGVYLIRHIDGNVFEINNKTCASKDVLDLLLNYQQEGLLQEYVEQSEFSASLYPNSTNTIRIVCARKRNERDFHIVAASQRIGTENSKPVDNIAAGGLVCSINIDTGELGYARLAAAGDVKRCITRYDKHPDTGVQLKGQVIPNWDKLKEEILSFTYKMPYLKIVGWDVLLTKDGIYVIEGNNGSCPKVIQCDEGYRNKELGDIYRSYGINSVNNIEIKM